LNCLLEVLQAHHCDVLWVDQVEELWLSEVFGLRDLGHLDDSLGHKVQLWDALKLPDEASVVEEVEPSLIEHLPQDLELAWPWSNTQSIKSTLKVLWLELTVAFNIKTFEDLPDRESVVS